MKKLSCILLAIMAAAMLAIAGCSKPAVQNSPTVEPSQSAQTEATNTFEATEEPTSTPEPAAFPVTVTDVMGTEVTIPSEPAKIVSLAPSTTEILFTLGIGGKLVGVDAFSDYPAEAANIEKIGDFNGPNIEAIAAQAPDVILAGNGLQQDAIDKLRELGIPVLTTEARAFDQIGATITMIGAATGTSEEAEKLVQAIDTKTQALKDAAAQLEKKDVTVYYALSYGEYGNWTSGPGSFINDIILLCGAVPVTQNAESPWVEYNMEALISANPDMILVGEPMKEGLLIADGYKDLDAVKNGNVFGADDNVCSRPGPRIIEAMDAFLAAIQQVANK